MTGGNGPNERSASSAGDEGVDRRAPGISPPLKRLLDDPKGLGAVSLWRALGADEREAATRAYMRAEHAGCRILSRVIAEARNFRPATVGKWPEDKIAAAMRFAPIREPVIALRLLQCHHVPGQVPMVTAFLDALGVSHDNGEIGSFEEVDADDDSVRPAVTGLVRDFGPQSVAVYLLALCLFRAPAGEKGRRCLLTLLEESYGEDAREPGESPPGKVEAVEIPREENQTEQEDPTRQLSFTTLDRLWRKNSHAAAPALPDGRPAAEVLRVRFTLGVAGHEIAVRPDTIPGRPDRWRACSWATPGGVPMPIRAPWTWLGATLWVQRAGEGRLPPPRRFPGNACARR